MLLSCSSETITFSVDIVVLLSQHRQLH